MKFLLRTLKTFSNGPYRRSSSNSIANMRREPIVSLTGQCGAGGDCGGTEGTMTEEEKRLRDIDTLMESIQIDMAKLRSDNLPVSRVAVWQHIWWCVEELNRLRERDSKSN